jgi:hypothetical protein
MSVCPFCKAQVAQSTAPCPRCGKLAADHPSIAAISGRTLSTDFDEDDHGELSLESHATAGSSGGGHAGMSFESGKGVTLDDDLFGEDEHSGPLELDVPDLPVPPPASSRKPEPLPPTTSKAPPGSDPRISSQKMPAAPPAAASSSGKMPAAPPPAPSSSSGRFAVAPDSSPDVAAPPEPPPPPSATDLAAVKIANFPPAPNKIWQAPKYALKVLYRQFELRQDLESLRRKRSPDVGLYERALRSHDARMYKTGLAITGVALFVGLILFFMPVIKRFAFAPD